MSDKDDDDLEVYVYHGIEGERIPDTVDKLIVPEGILQVLPDEFCCDYYCLKEVILPKNGLIKIGNEAFRFCEDLLEISISRTVQVIGKSAFEFCNVLAKVEFDSSGTSSPPHQHQIHSIEELAFSATGLLRIKLPSSVNILGAHTFQACSGLVEANLSTTSIFEISDGAFNHCSALQAVNLPNTLERIGVYAFWQCEDLVTVVVPLDCNSIEIKDSAFEGCRRLANLVLPDWSTATTYSFDQCDLLHECIGEEIILIHAALLDRFINFAIHRLCYDQSGTTVQKLRDCIAKQQQQETKVSLVDGFGITPLHVLLSTIEPRIELLDVLLELLPRNQILNVKDANRKRPLDYLTNTLIWTDEMQSLFERIVEKWMMDPLALWDATSWMEAIQSKVQDILAENEWKQRETLCDELHLDFEHYEQVQATSILEMALWKGKLKSAGSTTGGGDGGGTEGLGDREECRCLSGSNVVIPQVTMFLKKIPEEEDGHD